jgi:hypothetical protein
MNDINEKIKDLIGDDENILLVDGFEDAFIGIGRQFGYPVAVYDRSLCIDILKEDMSHEEAEEYFQFNVEGSYMGEGVPMFMEFCE